MISYIYIYINAVYIIITYQRYGFVHVYDYDVQTIVGLRIRKTYELLQVLNSISIAYIACKHACSQHQATTVRYLVTGMAKSHNNPKFTFFL